MNKYNHLKSLLEMAGVIATLNLAIAITVLLFFI